MLRLRLSQGLKMAPQNPPVGWVIWKVNSASGMERRSLLITFVDCSTCSRVEFEGVFTTPKMTPWSSAGANSLADCMNISTASTENTAHAA